MSRNNKHSVKRIIELLNCFITQKKSALNEEDRKDPFIFHYFTEILRFWNKIHYVVRKTLRSINVTEVDEPEIARIMYCAYRILWEKATLIDLIQEIKLKNRGILDKIKTFSWEIALKNKEPLKKLSINEAIPSFMIETLFDVMDIDFMKKNFEAMNKISEESMFAVQVSKSFEKVLNLCFINNLRKEIGISPELFQKDEQISLLYKIPIKNKIDIIKSGLIESGDLIILDKGSSIVVQVLSPEPDDFILDMCAAPGIKASAISYLTDNNARIIAAEFSNERITSMKNLLKNIKNPYTFPINTDSILFPQRNSIKYDKILLDAPCTGSGTFLANPEIKWRQNRQFLYQNVTLQEKLLHSAIELLKPSGILVYSVCSLYNEEGELQILSLLENNSEILEPLPLSDWFSPSYKINGKILSGTGRLFPAVHGTQGFFIAKFKKKKEFT